MLILLSCRSGSEREQEGVSLSLSYSPPSLSLFFLALFLFPERSRHHPRQRPISKNGVLKTIEREERRKKKLSAAPPSFFSRCLIFSLFLLLNLSFLFSPGPALGDVDARLVADAAGRADALAQRRARRRQEVGVFHGESDGEKSVFFYFNASMVLLFSQNGEACSRLDSDSL